MRTLLDELSIAPSALTAASAAIVRSVWAAAGAHELERWERELRTATNAKGQPYSDETIRTHIGHSAQFIRWLAGEWRPLGPRDRS